MPTCCTSLDPLVVTEAFALHLGHFDGVTCGGGAFTFFKVAIRVSHRAADLVPGTVSCCP